MKEEHHNSENDEKTGRHNRRGSGDTLKVDMVERPRRSSVVVGIGIGNLLASKSKKAQNFSFDKKKKGKDKKKLKITESLSSGSLEKFDLPKPKVKFFQLYEKKCNS